MQEKEFEEVINNNLEGFGIAPSAQVWTEVERRIGKEKKRRFAFWYWFLLLLLAGGILTALLLSKQENASPIVSANQTAKNISETNLAPKIKDTARFVNEHKDVSEKIPGERGSATAERSTPSAEKSRTENKKSQRTTFRNEGKIKSEIILPADEDKVENLINTKPKQHGANDVNNNHGQHKTAPSNLIIDSANTSNETMTIASVDEENENTDLDKADTAQHQSSLLDSLTSQPKEKLAPTKIRKWKRGVHIASGRSGFSNGILSLNKSLRADALYNYNSGIGSGQSTNAGPSPINASFYWSGGVFIQKSISKKLDISIGLDYSFLSTKNKIGSRVDSSRVVVVDRSLPAQVQVDHFYRPAGAGTSRSYSNQFHFIGLSADVAWKIVAAKKFTMYWENGISYNRLVSSNMLQYSRSLPGYYRDNNQLTNNQFVVETGLLFPLTKSLALKPFISYQLLPVFKNQQSANTHFSIVGLRLKYFLKTSINSATK